MTDAELSRRWAQFASELEFSHLPSRLVEVLKGLVLDTVGVAIAASTLGDCCTELAAVTCSGTETPECTVLGFGQRTSCLMAGLANGALAHALNFDALGRAGGHVGLAAVPAPLVMAERRGSVSGAAFLTAVAVGAECTARLAKALRAAKVDTSERSLEGQVLGVFGAALGAGSILRFAPERMHSVLGLALMQAAGTRQVSLEGGPAKAIYGGFPNQAALLAALLAQQGVDARCAALEGPAGLFGLFYGGRFDRAVVGKGLGQEFVSEDLLFKPWPTSSVLNPFIEAALRLRRRHLIDAQAIEQIVLHVGKKDVAWLEPAGERRHPQNAATAANSIFFAVAKALANGDVTLADLTPVGRTEPGSRRLADCMDYIVSGSGSRIEVRTRSGAVAADLAEGDCEAPAFDDLAVKFRDCLRHAARPLPDAQVETLITRIASLEREADIGDVLALTVPGTERGR